MTKKLALLGAAMTCLAVACSSSPATSESTTTAATTIAATTTTVTLPATTTAAPTTIPAPTTTLSPDDQLKAQIAADYEQAFFNLIQLFENPLSVDDDLALASIAVRDSEQFNQLKGRLEELRLIGDVISGSDPDTNQVIVESVELVGSPPYQEANLTVCEILNLAQVTPAANSPTGKEILVGGTEMRSSIECQIPCIERMSEIVRQIGRASCRERV